MLSLPVISSHWCGQCHNHQNLPGWRASQQQAMSAGQASDHLQSCEATIFCSALSSTLPSKRLCNATQRGGKAKQCKKQGICRTLILLRCFRRLATAPDGVMLCLAAVSFVVLNAVTFIYNKTSRQLKTKISVPSSRHPSVPGLFPSHRTNGFSSDSKLIRLYPLSPLAATSRKKSKPTQLQAAPWEIPEEGVVACHRLPRRKHKGNPTDSS